MSHADTSALEDRLREAKRNVRLLTVAQALLGAFGPISFAVGGLAGYQLLGDDKSLATAPLTGYNLGVAFGAIVVATVSRFAGRRESFVLGALMGAIGGVLASVALFSQSFWLFVLSLLMLGLAGGFTQKIRFAAADASPSSFKAQAISWILGGGIISAIVGPQAAILGKNLLEPVTFAGSFLMITPLAGVAILFFLMLRLPPLTSGPAAAASQTIKRPLREIVLTPRFLTGMLCGISTYALMTFMMTGAPLAMVVGCGFPSDLATLGIQWHVLAMFAPSFFTGRLIARFGAEKVVACGLVILMVCALVAHQGIALWNFWGALILLGVGWNFGFIGSTSIVASSYRPEEADTVQGFHDIILFSTVALSSFASGKVFYAFGWNAMNLAIWPVTVLGLVALALQMRRAKALNRFNKP